MNDQKKIIRPALLLLFPALCAALSIIIACASSITADEIWEGIQGDTLRVFVTVDRSSEYLSDGAQDTAREAVLQAGRNRAGTILLSYVRAHVTDRQRTDACLQSIPEIISQETRRFVRCSADTCTAVYDFDVKNFLDAAGRHESGR